MQTTLAVIFGVLICVVLITITLCIIVAYQRKCCTTNKYCKFKNTYYCNHYCKYHSMEVNNNDKKN